MTALTGLASHRDAVWIASAMTERDVEVAREHGGQPVRGRGARGRRRSACASSPPTPRPTTASTTSSPTRCCGSSSTTSGTRATRRTSAATRSRRSSTATTSSTRTSPSAVLEEIADQDEPVVMVHDYHLYTLPEIVRRERPDVFLHHFIHIPWTQPDAWRVLPTRMREEIFRGLLANDIVGFHTRSYRRNFLQCCRDLLDARRRHGGAASCASSDREMWVRAYPLPIDYEATRALAPSRAGARARGGGAAPPARVLDPARRPRRPLQERPARLHRLRHLPRAAPRVHRADHLHRAADALADRRPRVRRVPRAHRGARRGRQPPPRHAGLDADRPQAARRPRRGRRLLQALRRDDGQRHVRRHEPGGQGGPAGQRARRRLDPVARTRARTRSSASSRSP